MCFAEMKGCVFADCQEWNFQAANRTDMFSANLQEGQFADCQESRFQGAKRSNMGNAVKKLV